MDASDFKAIAELDLEPIKVKLMHAESGEGWTLERANAVEFEYRRFLYLMKKFPNEQTAPLQDVDTFWHYHILDTLKYATDCQRVFGYFLHHFPYIGLRGEADERAHERVGARMKELYEDTFGEPYGRNTVAFSGAPVKDAARAAFSGAPVREARAAFSGAPVRDGAQLAFSGAPVRSEAQVAFSGVPVRSEAQVAFSGAPVRTAFSGAPVRNAESAQVAFSGAPVRTAFSGSPTHAPAQFYAERPSLASSAA
ncbi:glycine-rich domain-containing protein-like [Massilia sp. YMA4]|uniref:glycine-rich domain-containing protein n=1 Tax=Massilia sp. YMA4 TaxID=1593482 RepID=UPI000DD16967|nr:glycine-rich domain-containing protein-like [Massilia sp. YMA4]AXA92028.1 hypothetical protein DPH57_13240 [Massilia sp. YMA4]